MEDSEVLRRIANAAEALAGQLHMDCRHLSPEGYTPARVALLRTAIHAQALADVADAPLVSTDPSAHE